MFAMQKGKQTEWGQQPLLCAVSYPRYHLTTLVLTLALSSDTLAYTRSNAAQHALLSLISMLIQEEPRSIPRKDCIVENWLGHIIPIT